MPYYEFMMDESEIVVVHALNLTVDTPREISVKDYCLRVQLAVHMAHIVGSNPLPRHLLNNNGPRGTPELHRRGRILAKNGDGHI